MFEDSFGRISSRKRRRGKTGRQRRAQQQLHCERKGTFTVLLLPKSVVVAQLQEFGSCGSVTRRQEVLKLELEEGDVRPLQKRPTGEFSGCPWMTENWQQRKSIQHWPMLEFRYLTELSVEGYSRCRTESLYSQKEPFMSVSQRQKRLQWAKEHSLWLVDQWKTVSWSDESRISIFGSDAAYYIRRRPGEECLPASLTPTMKHPLGVMV